MSQDDGECEEGRGRRYALIGAMAVRLVDFRSRNSEQSVREAASIH